MPNRPKPLPQVATELYELVIAYLKQETTVPLKALARYVALGVVGSLLIGFGVVFCTMAALRALQTETNGDLGGDWSWVPYLIVIAGLALGAAITWKVGTRRRKESA